MSDAISRYRDASEQSDTERIVALLAPDAELVSPISGRMVFRGTRDLSVLFSAVYGTLSDLRWSEAAGDVLGLKMTRHPGVIWRALRRP